MTFSHKWGYARSFLHEGQTQILDPRTLLFLKGTSTLRIVEFLIVKSKSLYPQPRVVIEASKAAQNVLYISPTVSYLSSISWLDRCKTYTFWPEYWYIWIRGSLQVNLCQKLFFCRTWEEHVVYKNCSECKKRFLYTTCSPHVWAWNFRVLNL